MPILTAQIEDLNEDYANFGQAGPVHRLNDSASLKIVIKIDFNFSDLFLKLLELLVCRRSDPYMTANRNIVRFAHS